MTTITDATTTLYNTINSLPGPGRFARLVAALLVTPFAAAAPSLSRRTTTALVENPSFDTFPHPVPGGNFVHRCDNTKGVLSLGTKGVTVCDLTSSSCHTLSDPSGSTFTGRVVLEHGDAALPCNGLFWGQSYTDAGGSQVRVGKYTGSGFTVQGSSPASSGANQLTTSSMAVNENRVKFYVGTGFAGTTENGYLITRLYDDGKGGVDSHKENRRLSPTGNVEAPQVYTASWVSPLGSRLSIIQFAINPDTPSGMVARVGDSNFGSMGTINVPSSSTALTKLQTQNLPNEQFLSAVIGDGSTIHLNLLHMPAESKIPSKLDSSDLSLTSVDHISISPPDASGTTKLYWSSGGIVSVANINVHENTLSITGQATLFDLGNVTLEGLSTTTYQNGKQVVAYGLSGQTKVWVGDVVVPEASSAAAAAATSTAPAAMSTAPAATSTAPAAMSTAPAAMSTAPAAMSTAPAAMSTAPAAMSTAPAAMSTAPAATSTAPVATSTVPAAPGNVTLPGNGGPAAQGSSGGSSAMGVVAGVIVGVVLLVFTTIVVVWRRRGRSDRKLLVNLNNADIDRRQLGTASETSMEEVVAVKAGMLPGGVHGSGQPPQVPPPRKDDWKDEPEMYATAPVSQRVGNTGDYDIRVNNEAVREERQREMCGSEGKNGDGGYVNADYGRGNRGNLQSQDPLSSDGEYCQPNNALPLEMEDVYVNEGEGGELYANRTGPPDSEVAQMTAIAARLRRDSDMSNPLDVSGSSGNGDTSSSDPESPPVGAVPQPPGWVGGGGLGPTASRASIHV